MPAKTATPDDEAAEEADANNGDMGQTKSEKNVNNRTDAYRQLARIAGVLEDVDRHSPVPDLLRCLVRFEGLGFGEMSGVIDPVKQFLKEVNKVLDGNGKSS